MSQGADPFALTADGTPVDVEAFRTALKADPTKLAALEAEPEVYGIVMGEDVDAFKELMRSVFQARGRTNPRF